MFVYIVQEFNRGLYVWENIVVCKTREQAEHYIREHPTNDRYYIEDIEGVGF